MKRKKTPARKKRSPRPKYRFENRVLDLVTGITSAIADLRDLGEECRSIVDNASEGLSQSQRIQTLDETASALENLDEIDVPSYLDAVKIVYQEMSPYNKRRPQSRATRCANACAILSSCVEKLSEGEDWYYHDADKLSTVEDLGRECQEAIDSSEGLDFPGMYG
jgi:hypothetical protein